jgi:hypothetical protein
MVDRSRAVKLVPAFLEQRAPQALLRRTEMFVQWEDGDRDSVNREPASRIFGIYIYLTIIPVANLLKYKCIHPICADQLYRSNTEIKIE